MPELPDVETFRRYFDATATGRVVEKVHLMDAERMLKSSATTVRRHLEGHRLASTRRHGKHLLVELVPKDTGEKDGEADSWLALHFGMTGFLQAYGDVGEGPDFTHLVLDLSDGKHLAGSWQRKLGAMEIAASPEAFIKAHDLGPDALDEGFTAAALGELLRDRRGKLKPALMDQSLIAGIGNVYCDEMLFQAGLHPESRPDKLTDEEISRLHRVMRHVLGVAVASGAEVKRLPETWLTPLRYTKDAECPGECSGKLERTTVSGRTTLLCPSCQQKK